MSSISPESVPKGQEGFREIPSSIFKFEERYDFDIYIKVKDQHRLLLAKSMLVSPQHLKIIEGGKMKLFATNADWRKVQEYETLHLSSILEDPDVSSLEKANLAISTSMESINEIMGSGESKSVRHMEPLAEDMARSILSEDRVMSNLVWVSIHDHFTYQHSVRVGLYATALTMKLFGDRLSRAEMCALSEGYFLHDVGMAQVPLAIIDKRGALTDEEWRIIRMHPIWGYEQLKEKGTLTPENEKIVLSHHERSTGKGYPHRVTAVPIYTKICSLADVFESLTAVRPYRRPKDTFTALKIIQQEMAGEFGSELLKAFILMLGPRG